MFENIVEYIISILKLYPFIFSGCSMLVVSAKIYFFLALSQSTSICTRLNTIFVCTLGLLMGYMKMNLRVLCLVDLTGIVSITTYRHWLG